MAASASLASAFVPFRCSLAVATGRAAAAAAAAWPSAPWRSFASQRPDSAAPGEKKEILSLFDRRVTSDFLGSGEDAALSAADRLIRQPPPIEPENTRIYSGAPPKAEDEEDTLRWHERSLQEKEQLLGDAFMKSVDPTYFKPKLITPPYGIHVGRLTAWGYKPQYLDIWLDFAQRAAVALNIPCSEIKVLPDAVRRYTVFKAQTTRKKKDVWEWRRYFRQVDIFDAHPDVIDRWVHYAGTSVGDHVFWNFDRITYDELGVGTRMLEQAALENGGSKSPRRKKRLSR